MAPSSKLMSELLSKRQGNYGYDDCYYSNDCSSGWNNWGRWVALVVIVVVVILIAFIFSCLNNRRRRRRGAPPMYATGWVPTHVPWSNKPPGQSSGYYHNDPYNGGAAPPYEPPLGNQATGNTFNSNDGYYGHHNGNGFELQQPQSSYQPQRGGDPVYAAPDGPPPEKGGGIIR